MSLGQFGSGASFRDSAQGMTGRFSTPAGQVDYLMTKARLGADAADAERRLTQHLVPVREVIDSADLDFNQLLQRDLDDHRVAVSLVPYLLNPERNGPAFFPPIVAVLLPFASARPSDFPELGPRTIENEGGLSWSQRDAGESLRIRRLVDDKGNDSSIALGEVKWNSEFCKLVVVDGQHRAMALLAIDRTLRSAWQGSTGGKYRYFYESRIKELLQNRVGVLEDIEVPVTLLWFPEKFGSGHEPHKAARKVFVDVNKEARTPSESRLILLSDSELINIFVRTTLTDLRNQSGSQYLPLYCVEYDNPDVKSTTSARWSALTNIHAIKQMISRSVFGPPKYINRLDAVIGKREPEEERNAFMRTQLRVDEIFDPTIEGDEPFNRDELGNKNFPDSAVVKLSESYRDTWGRALLTLLSGLLPYAAHAKALSRLKDAWLLDDAISTLANDALFGGVGMYWTLRDSAIYWQRERELYGSTSKPDVVKAWELIVKKQSEFELFRAEEYLGKASRFDESNQLYQAVNTHACQLGLALTLASIVKRASLDGPDQVASIAGAMKVGINTWLESRNSGAYDRRLALSKRNSKSPARPLNVIANMDSPRAVQFRYFWLEILASNEGFTPLHGLVDGDKLLKLRDEARHAYLVYIIGEKNKALRTTRPDLKDKARQDLATSEASKEIRGAITKWFDIANEDLADWSNFGGHDSAPDSEATLTDDDQDSDDVLADDADMADDGVLS